MSGRLSARLHHELRVDRLCDALEHLLRRRGPLLGGRGPVLGGLDQLDRLRVDLVGLPLGRQHLGAGRVHVGAHLPQQVLDVRLLLLRPILDVPDVARRALHPLQQVGPPLDRRRVLAPPLRRGALVRGEQDEVAGADPGRRLAGVARGGFDLVQRLDLGVLRLFHHASCRQGAAQAFGEASGSGPHRRKMVNNSLMFALGLRC
ncbi:hypothetical protein [Methylobacterium radiotolerans]|uniref:hypothetical protein n=1 Tax=Methylobacterium radiotolerans TaxID=31998 RepID=UPI002F356C9B